jgi:RND family efflux transporter MFP subunit
MQIDPVKQQAAVSSQEDTRTARQAALQFAKQEYERVKGLQASGIASVQDLDRAKSALDAAQADLNAVEAQVREQQAQLRYYRVTAPAAGIVGDIPVRVGDRVTVGTLLTTVDSPGLMEAYVHVPVERARELRLGLPVRIVDSAGQVAAESRITFVSPQVEDQTQTVLVKAGIAMPGQLRPAQFIRARVVWGTRQAPTVPVIAVSRISGQHFAFVAEDEKGTLVARQRPVQVGEIVGNDYVVTGGIKPGDRVIVSGTQFLRDGVPVAPQS